MYLRIDQGMKTNCNCAMSYTLPSLRTRPLCDLLKRLSQRSQRRWPHSNTMNCFYLFCLLYDCKVSKLMPVYKFRSKVKFLLSVTTLIHLQSIWTVLSLTSISEIRDRTTALAVFCKRIRNIKINSDWHFCRNGESCNLYKQLMLFNEFTNLSKDFQTNFGKIIHFLSTLKI